MHDKGNQGTGVPPTGETSSLKGRIFDCVVVGGGPAGLSAALYLGRLRRSTLVIDSLHGRSTWHQVNRNYLGFPDGVHATALRELGETQARRYGVDFVEGAVDRISCSGDGREKRFTCETSAGPFVSRTLILATGVSDNFPEFEGSQQCIGKSMFWCIFCDGYEAIDKKVVVLGHTDHAAALALQLLVFTAKVTLVSWDGKFDLDEKRVRSLEGRGIATYESDCVGYECREEGYIHSIRLADDEQLDLDMLFVAQKIEPNTQLANQLKLSTNENGYIRTDAEQCTNVEGVFAAGDVTRLFSHQVASAVHEGAAAAAAANYYLYEDWQKD